MNFLVKLAEMEFTKVVAIALGLTAAYYFLQFDDGSSLDSQYRAAQGQLTEEQATLARTEKAVKDIDDFKLKLANQENQLREVMSFFPPEMNEPQLLSMIMDRARDAGMEIVRTEPKPEKSRVEFFEMMKVDILLRGTYAQGATFLSYVSSLPRLVTVEKMSLKAIQGGDAENPRIEFSATLVGYRSLEEAAVDPNKAKQPGAPNAP